MLHDHTHMLECTRRRRGSTPRGSDSTSSEYAQRPPTSSAACVHGPKTVSHPYALMDEELKELVA